MNNRLMLHEKLVELVGNQNVYFQPPASVKLSYPCVIYSIGNGDAKHANNKVYNYINSYEILFIYKNPNLDIIDKVLNEFSMCTFGRWYSAYNLNHYAFTLYY